MGLDQYAVITQNALSEATDIEQATIQDFYWRKHAKLQEWMERLWEARGNDRGSFNCANLELSKDEILELLKAVSDCQLPESPGGFFYGHQFQEDSVNEYREQDIEFCHTAIKAINNGQHVTYYCWY